MLYCDIVFLHCADNCNICEAQHLETNAKSNAFIPSTFLLAAATRDVSVSLNSQGHLILLEPEQLSVPTIHESGSEDVAPVAIGAVINGLPTLRAAIEHESNSVDAMTVDVQDVVWLDVLRKPIKAAV